MDAPWKIPMFHPVIEYWTIGHVFWTDALTCPFYSITSRLPIAVEGISFHASKEH